MYLNIFKYYYRNKKICKKIDFNVSNENAWEIGLACGGDISIYIEEIK